MTCEVFRGSAGPADRAWNAAPGWSWDHRREAFNVLYGDTSGFPRWRPNIHFRYDPRSVAYFARDDGKMLHSVGTSMSVVTPYWAPACLFIVAPVGLVIRRVRTWRRSRTGRCAACGYNLTGNLSGVCPECGGGAA